MNSKTSRASQRQDERATPAVDSLLIDEDMHQRISLKLLEALPGFLLEQR